jgi:hypothetical protein
MDTKTLVVGQEIRIFTGYYTCTAKVVKVMPGGTIVEGECEMVLRFNNLGKGLVVNGPSHIDYPEGPWFIEGVDWQSKDVIESTVDRNP